MRHFAVTILSIAVAATAGLAIPTSAAARGPASAYRTAVLADKPVAYYRLDESAAGGRVPNRAFMIDSALNNTGYYLGATSNAIVRVPELTTNDTAGDSAANFSAAGFAATLNYWQFHFAYAMTVEAWIRWTGEPAGTIVSFGDAGRAPYDNFKLGYDALTHKLSYQIALGHTARVVEAVTPKPNVVYHLVGTFDGSVQRLYINGVLRSAQRLHGAIGDYNANPALGLNVANDSTHMHPAAATVDEVALYPTALSAARIANHYLTGLSIAPYTIAALSSGAGDAYVGGINQAGDVVGSVPAFSPTGPAVYAGGRVIPLGPPGSLPYAINDRGGVLLANGSDGLYRCTVANAVCVHLQPLALPCPQKNTPYTAPGGLSNAGVITGTETNVLCSGPRVVVAVRWDSSNTAALVFAPTTLFTRAYGSDDAGLTLGGESAKLAGPFAPVLIGEGRQRHVAFLVNGTTIAHNGDVLGSMYPACAYGVVRNDAYAASVPIDPIPYANAQSMNALDQVVGYGQLPNCTNDGIGSISAAGEAQAMPLSALIPARAGWTNLAPIAIDDRGEIAGTGSHNGLRYIFKMTPYPF